MFSTVLKHNSNDVIDSPTTKRDCRKLANQPFYLRQRAKKMNFIFKIWS